LRGTKLFLLNFGVRARRSEGDGGGGRGLMHPLTRKDQGVKGPPPRKGRKRDKSNLREDLVRVGGAPER